MTDRKFREKLPADTEAVLDLTTRAFGRPDEARIIEQLEKDGDALLQLVAEVDDRIVGHILFYPLGVMGKLSAIGLGPMSVEPWMQREGIGKQLVTAGLAGIRQAGGAIVFVLGHADYYPKFGFSVEATKDFETPLKGPHFMANRLRFGPPMSGRLIFPAAFGVGSA
jgi:putative acetyltransferase